ncbi:MAG: STAS domain-containing protein [Nocardiaceae bacterium]|nr:STAS domain-containing protein [Nocardiaceae bacterium]
MIGLGERSAETAGRGFVVSEITDDSTLVLRMRGEIDASNRTVMWDCLVPFAAVVAETQLVVIDLTKVTFISAAALRVIDDFIALAETRGARVRAVAAPNTIVARVLQIVPIARPCPIFSTVSEALAS